jgi:uncharacterized membrane protein
MRSLIKIFIAFTLTFPVSAFADQFQQEWDRYLADETELIQESRGRMRQSRGIVTGESPYSQERLKEEIPLGGYDGYHLEVRMLDGHFKDQIIKVDFTLYREDVFREKPDIGSRVLIGYLIDNEGNIYNPAIYGQDRLVPIIILILLFIIGIIALGRVKGLLSLIALSLSIVLVFVMFIPAVIDGASPLWLSVLVALIASTITFLIIAGFTKKAISATLGSVIGFVIAAFLVLIFGRALAITGVMDSDMVSLRYTTSFNVGELIFAGILIGAIGAIMDVAISIASTVDELKKANPGYTVWQLFKSSLNVGKDLLGTMVNTLIFAYVGTALPFIILIYIQYAGHTPLQNILNLEKIAMEILRSIIGSLGMATTIPATALIASLLKSRTTKKA